MLGEMVPEFTFLLKVSYQLRSVYKRLLDFFADEIKHMCEEAGFVEKENRADRRLQVNRGRLLKMYRVWIQAKYEKPK